MSGPGGLKGWIKGPSRPGEKVKKGSLELDRRRIAVLPFSNMSPDPNDEFFADGLTEEMITELSELSGVGVIARTSVMHYKNSEKSVKEIARDLGVGSVLEGSVRKAGNRIRITAQLIDGRNEEHLWAQRFDRDLNDIFAVQSEIAGSVARALELKLVPRNTPNKPSPENLDVYTLCLKARFLWNRRTKEGIQQAMLLFEEALKLDPDSARVNAGLADCYLIAADRRFMDRDEGEVKAMEFVTRALELDRTLPEAHATLGLILSEQQKYVDAEKELRMAISLNPNYASAHHWYYLLLVGTGRLREGLDEIMKAAELDPLSPIINGVLAQAFAMFAGRLDDAMSVIHKLIQTEPGMPFAYAERSYFHSMRGQRNEALADLEMFYKLDKNECRYKVLRAECEAILGNKEEALRLVEAAVPLIETSHDPVMPQWVYGIIGDRDAYFKWVDRAIERKVSALILSINIRFPLLHKAVREDPRYVELFKKLNLP